MTVYRWCSFCQSRTCADEQGHLADGRLGYRADFWLGGRTGKRVRKVFPMGKTAKEDAKSFEIVTQADYKRGTYLPQKSTLTVNELADKYWNDHCLKENHEPDKDTRYRIELIKRLLGSCIVTKVSRAQVRELRAELRNKWSGATVNRFINGVLKPMFNKGIEWELIDRNPCEHLPKVEESDPIPRFLTTGEIGKLYQTMTNKRLRDFADVILHTGARPSSIRDCSFDNGDVDFGSRTIWFTTFKGRRRYRYAHPIDDTLLELLNQRAAQTGQKGKVFDTSGLPKLARRAIERSGLNEGRTPEQWFTIYGLKHCYASHLLMSGASIFDVAKLLGHTDTKMVVKHYGHLTQEHLRKVQAKVNLTPPNEVQFRVA